MSATLLDVPAVPAIVRSTNARVEAQRRGGFTTSDVVRITGASFRQVNYWRVEGLIAGAPTEIGNGNALVWSQAQIDAIVVLVATCPACGGTGRRTPLRTRRGRL